MERKPLAVYANIGDGDNLVPIKCFDTEVEAQAWMEQMRKERPGHYHIDCADESAHYE